MFPERAELIGPEGLPLIKPGGQVGEGLPPQLVKAQSGIVVDPLTIAPSRTLEEALAIMRHHRISGLPVVDAEKRPVGILTNRDVRFEKRLTLQVGELMTKNPVTVRDGVSSM